MATTNRRTRDRTYGQYCPIAAGLDLIGDRWTLLMLRELSMGDRRFTDLRTELPGLAPNLLTERLRSLEAAGLVSSVDLPAPATRRVYRLTDEGRRIEPVLRSVARFGSRYLDGEPTEAVSARRVAYALLAPWRRRAATKIRARLIVSTGDRADADADRVKGTETGTDAVDLVLDVDTMQVESVEGTPDVTLRVRVTDLVAARRTGDDLVGQLSGPAASRRIFLDQFRLRMTKTPQKTPAVAP